MEGNKLIRRAKFVYPLKDNARDHCNELSNTSVQRPEEEQNSETSLPPGISRGNCNNEDVAKMEIDGLNIEKRDLKPAEICNKRRSVHCVNCNKLEVIPFYLKCDNHEDLDGYICALCQQPSGISKGKYLSLPKARDYTYKCKVCKMTFPGRERLKHERMCGKNIARMKKSANNRRIKNQYANKNEAVEKKHMNQKGKSLSAYHCSECRKDLETSRLYKIHLETNCGKDLPKCELCMKTFSSQRTLKSHLLTHDDRSKDYECGICRKKYYRKHDMQRHVLGHSSTDNNSTLKHVLHEKHNMKSSISIKGDIAHKTSRHDMVKNNSSKAECRENKKIMSKNHNPQPADNDIGNLFVKKLNNFKLKLMSQNTVAVVNCERQSDAPDSTTTGVKSHINQKTLQQSQEKNPQFSDVAKEICMRTNDEEFNESLNDDNYANCNNIDSKLHECEFCGKKFTRGRALSNHVLTCSQ